MGPGHEDKPAAGDLQVGLAALHLQRGDCTSYQLNLDRKQLVEHLNRLISGLLPLGTPL